VQAGADTEAFAGDRFEEQRHAIWPARGDCLLSVAALAGAEGVEFADFSV
jgi:hypothetical protein